MQQISFADPAIQTCPFPHYNSMREEAPVYLDQSTGLYVLTRFDDVQRVLLDHKRFSSDTGLIQTRPRAEVQALYQEKGWPPVPTLLNNDPPHHRAFRGMVDKAFTPKRIRELEPYILRNVTELIDRFADDAGEIEIMQNFAVILPLTVIADLAGMPRDMIGQMIVWADAGVESTGPVLSPERELELVEHAIQFQNYFAARAEELRAHPEDNLYSDLIHAEIDGRSPNMQELLSIMQIIMVAGYETTTSALGSGIAQFCEKPELADELRRNPEKTGAFVEEILRIYSPLQGLFRRAVEDVEIDGVVIPSGAIVIVRYGAANRDPEKFVEPDRLDICRGNRAQHVAFGFGIHHCVGHGLARAELRIAFDELLRRFRSLRYARDAASWHHKPSFVTWGAQKLFVHLAAA